MSLGHLKHKEIFKTIKDHVVILDVNWKDPYCQRDSLSSNKNGKYNPLEQIKYFHTDT